MLTPPGVFAPVRFDGSDISPGRSTSLAFDIVKKERLGEPYGSCKDVLPTGESSSDIQYSFVECRNNCLQDKVYEACGCLPTKYPSRRVLNIPNCGSYLFNDSCLQKIKLDCQNEVLDNAETLYDFEKECQCYRPCKDTQYQISSSQSQWPSHKSIRSFIKNVLEDHPERDNLKAYKYYQHLLSQNASLNDIEEWIQGYFFRLNVYARSETVSVKVCPAFSHK